MKISVKSDKLAPIVTAKDEIDFRYLVYIYIMVNGIILYLVGR